MTRRMRFTSTALLLVAGFAALWRGDLTARQAAGGGNSPAQAIRQAQASISPAGQSTTRLSDGRWLIVGGEGAEAVALLWDPQTNVTTPTRGALDRPRAWHSATLLSDGTVLVANGQSRDIAVAVPELFDPATQTFTPLTMVGAIARASHTATLLTDGRVLMAGGSNGGTTPLASEVWDLQAHTATPLETAAVDRVDQTATLRPDGGVQLSGGRTFDGAEVRDELVIDAQRGTMVHVPPPDNERIPPRVTGSIPTNGATEVPVDAHVALRFSDAMVVETLTADTVKLAGPDGAVLTHIIPAEQGRLAFLWPAEPLAEESTYTVTVSGAIDVAGIPMPSSSLTFTTSSRSLDPTVDTEEWIPDADSIRNGWRTNRPPSPWESLAPLTAPPGTTAISGRVLALDGRPLPGVTLAVEDDASTESDRTGRFLLILKNGAAGHRVLQIDGETASRPNRKYGFYEYGLDVPSGQTTVLPFTIWQPKLDISHTVKVSSPTTGEVVVTTPYIPGLELHLPTGSVLRGEDGDTVTEVGLTPIPVDRPPFPLAKNVEVPVYFTAQPGGTYVAAPGGAPNGAWLVYPNYRGAIADQRVQFFHYDPDVRGWYVYGIGRVTPNATQVVPDPSTRFYSFTGAMINSGNSPPNQSPSAQPQGRGDPMDPSSGLFVMTKTDLYLPDVVPLALTRSYSSGDGLPRAFGYGMVNPYAMFLWSAQQYQQADLVLPNGAMIHYTRTSPGTGFADAIFTASPTPTEYAESQMLWNGNGWDLRLADGTVYVFGENAPLQAIRDRYGSTTTIAHSNGAGGNVTQVTSPNGRWIAFTYDGSNRVTQAKDNIGRTVIYTYDGNGNLFTVTDADTKVTTYTYDTSHRMLTIKDGRQIVYLTNTYVTGRVDTQTLADPQATFHFAYTTDQSGNITRTDITDPRGHVERLAFNSDHFVTSDTQAFGTSLARTTTFERQASTNFVTAAIDPLNRRTEYTYDASGHVLTTTHMAGMSEAVTTTYAYEPIFHQLTSVTDPLQHTWTLGYDAQNRLTSTSDPLSHASTIVLNAAGQVTSVTDPLTHQWQTGYTSGDRTSTTNPLGAVWRQFVDAGGRIRSTTDPLGHITRIDVDALNRTTTVTDALGGQTNFNYDPNSNLLTLTDALNHPTTYSYDTSDRVATRTDPLQKQASYGYDKNDHLTQVTDRKQQVTGYQYDELDRLNQVTFQDSSTITYAYDAGDRLTQIADAANGTITRGYDNFDRLTSETTPQGSISYTYDGDGRRATMTVAGQTQVTYAYDDAHRLTSITQGTSVVSITYDNANRRSTVTYPNGIVAIYGYDNANQLTSLAYTLSGNPVGDLTYTYDLAGQRINVGGSWARTGLPQALTSATYDAGNRLVTWGSQVFSYDLNGNLASDGPTSYTSNTRNQLAGLSGGTSATFEYDGTGRRRGKTVSGATTQFLYDGLNFVQELSGGGAVTANLLTGLGIDETFTRTDTAGTRNLLIDALGSTLALADASGVVQTQYSYEPFGGTTVSGAGNSASVQFTGRESDFVGLYFYRARFYSSGLQRFVSEDPVGIASGEIDLFAYAFNAPTRFSDPTGEAVFLAPPGTFPSCERLAGRKDPTWSDQLWCGLDLGQMLPGPGTIHAPAFTADQDALLQLAKEARRLGGVSEDAANTLLKWAKELGMRTSEGIEVHPGRNFDVPHIKIGPVNHIPVK
jgi:RHS repeat-associated protein